MADCAIAVVSSFGAEMVDAGVAVEVAAVANMAACGDTDILPSESSVITVVQCCDGLLFLRAVMAAMWSSAARRAILSLFLAFTIDSIRL